MTAVLFAVCVVGLVLGPLLLRLPGKSMRWKGFLDGFILVGVGGIAALHLLPEAVKVGGWWAVIFAIIGAILPVWFEHRAARVGAGLASALLLIGLTPHVALESAALRASAPSQLFGLIVAVAAHRLPVGMVLFSTVSKRFGQLGGWAAVGVLILATAGGLWSGESVMSILPATGANYLQALVGGSLLHVAFSSHFLHEEEGLDHDCLHCTHERGERVASFWPAVGGILGGVVLTMALTLGHDHGHGHHHADHHGHHHGHHHVSQTPEFIDALWTLVCQIAPALLIAFIGAGVLGVFVRSLIGRRLGRLGDEHLYTELGLPLSVASCGILPFYELLVIRGVKPPVAMLFLLGMPSLSLATLLLSVTLVGPLFTLVWVLASVVLIVIGAQVIGRSIKGNGVEQAHMAVEDDASILEKVQAVLRFGLVDMFDHIMPWVVAGLLIAATVEPLFSHNLLEQVPTIAQIGLFIAAALPFYFCSTGMVPLAAIAIHKGISPGATLAFLLVGPSASRATFETLARLHGKRIAWIFGVVLVVLATGAGLFVNTLAIDVLSDLHTHHHHARWYELVCLGVLAVLCTLSLFRQGPRGLLSQLLQPGHNHEA